jgi:hypothetical protein
MKNRQMIYMGILICTILFFYCSIVAQPRINIIRTLSNWDAHNLMDDSLAVDNFELEFYGDVDKRNIIDIYKGPNRWGLPVRICDYPKGVGTEITWFDRVHPIHFCQTKHFGVDLSPQITTIGDSLPDIDVKAYWTRIEKELVPFPFATWYFDDFSMSFALQFFIPCCLMDIMAAATIDEAWYAYTDSPLTLDSLKWDVPASWILLDTLITVSPGMPMEFPIPDPNKPGALLIQYSLIDPSISPDPYAYISIQGIVEEDEYGYYSITKMSINFDIHNITDESKDNLELDFFGYLRKEDIKDYFKGPKSWGNPPRIQEFDYASLPPIIHDYGIEQYVEQLPGGLEITWMDKCNPIPPCNWAHFGLSTGVGVWPGEIPQYVLWPDEYLSWVMLHWTKVIKVAEVPFPWQWWQVDPELAAIRDIIQLSSSFDGAVNVQREFAVIPKPLTLDSLHFNPNITSRWQVVDDKPVEIRSGKTLDIDIPLTGNMYGAVLVRYNVYEPDKPEVPVIRMINQAEFYDPSPKTGVQLNTTNIPKEFVLKQNYPNPFNMETKIQVGVPEPARVSLMVLNTLGQKIRVINDDTLPSGTHTFVWDGRNDHGNDLPSGVYFCAIKAKGLTKTIKMMLTK